MYSATLLFILADFNSELNIDGIEKRLQSYYEILK